ncbi:hypothetical protein AMECASPLE_034821 [Ameca splendens]|uniref:Uncharacterized protein n=1 Tax=Ameca splendens TaxID=208324 RepID=A0ABV0XK69_9TELE
MDQCEDRKDGLPPTKATLCEQHENLRKLLEPEPSCVSFKSGGSKDNPFNNFRAHFALRQKIRERSYTSEPGCGRVSFKSNWSNDHPLVNFKRQPASKSE